MTISYALHTENRWIIKSSNLSISIDDLNHLIDDPFQVIKEGGFNVHRNVENTTHQVFGWRTHQRIILQDKLTLLTSDKITTYSTNYWNVILDQFQLMNGNLEQNLEGEIELPIPLSSFIGYYGYLSYEISRLLEDYNYRDDDISRPYLLLDFPTRLLVCSPDYFLYLEIDLPPLTSNYEITRKLRSTDLIPGRISHDTMYEEYIADLESIIHHIRKGDIYQANYTQQFRLQVPDDIELTNVYSHILSTNFLPHSAYLNYGNFEVMSISPELFLQVTDGKVITKPIKGTRPRGQTDEEDAKYINELISSTKDQAELAMIVDLLRNDLGKSALAGSVEVDNHAVVESYENVHHLVSTVSANIPADISASWRLLLRAFPGGSISGVPKIRSLEIIEEHEKVTRDIYTGNIGFLGLNGDIEFNIAIRTVILDQLSGNHSMATFNAGGGIVFDSIPFEEYIESLHKAKHLANYLKHSFVGDVVWFDGSFTLAQHLTIDTSDNGIFETILVENGIPQLWEYHLQRLNRGRNYYNLVTESVSQDLIQQLLRLNLATTEKIRLNIYMWKDNNLQEHCLVKLQKYDPPVSPLSLLIDDRVLYDVPDAIQEGLKSLQYDLYREATRKAISHDCWDQILVDDNKWMLEGGRSTLYFYRDDSWQTSDQKVVHGTIRQFLLDQDLVEATAVSRDDLSSVTAIVVSNALIGLQPVSNVRDTTGSTIWAVSDLSVAEELQTRFNSLMNQP